MLNTVEMADAYFARNFFYKNAWSELDNDTKQLLIETAEKDVNAYLRTQNVDYNVVYDTFTSGGTYYKSSVDMFLDTSGSLPYFKPTCYQCAVFEWAIFIYQHKDAIMSVFDKLGADVTSVKVDEIGSETYWTRRGDGLQSDAYMRIFKKSPAMRFLDMIQKEIRIIR